VKRFQKLSLAVLISLFLLILDSFDLFDGAKRVVVRFLGERKEGAYQKIIGPTEEKERLKRKLASCQAEVLELKEENFRSRRLLDAGFKPETGVVLAKVVSSGSDSLIIRVSGEETIKKGASVVVDRVVLGRIEETDGINAKVLLLNSPKIKIPAKIWLSEADLKKNGPALAEGVLVGNGRGVLVKEVLASERVKENDFVGLVIETGEVFLVGKAKKVSPAGDKIFQEVEVAWLADPKSLLTVGVIR